MTPESEVLDLGLEVSYIGDLGAIFPGTERVRGGESRWRRPEHRPVLEPINAVAETGETFLNKGRREVMTHVTTAIGWCHLDVTS